MTQMKFFGSFSACVLLLLTFVFFAAAPGEAGINVSGAGSCPACPACPAPPDVPRERPALATATLSMASAGNTVLVNVPSGGGVLTGVGIRANTNLSNGNEALTTNLTVTVDGASPVSIPLYKANLSGDIGIIFGVLTAQVRGSGVGRNAGDTCWIPIGIRFRSSLVVTLSHTSVPEATGQAEVTVAYGVGF